MSANLMQKNRVNVSDDRLKISKISKMLKNENEISFDGDLLETIKNFFWHQTDMYHMLTFNADISNVYHNVVFKFAIAQWVDTACCSK